MSQVQSLNYKIIDEFKSKFNQEARKYGCDIDNVEMTPLKDEKDFELKNITKNRINRTDNKL